MATEIGQLVAKFLADTSHFDRGIVGVEKGINRATGAVGKLGLQSTALGGLLGTLGSRIQGISTLSSEMGASMGLLGVSLGVVSTVSLGLGVAMFKLAKYAADAGDEIFDLTQKVNFSAESISALKNAGETAGVEFGAISASLGIFNKNIEAANQGDEKLSRTFRILKIDIRDNETALRGAFKALLNVRDGGQQGALAMQIFGRSGKEVLGIIKATNGDLDAAIKRYQELGTLIGTDAADAANKFSDQLKELEQKLQGVARTMGQQFMPVVLDALEKFDAALDSNRGHAKSWADNLVSIVSFAARQIQHILEGAALVIEGFNKTFGQGSLFERISQGGSVSTQDNLVNRMKRRGMLPGPLIDPNKQEEGEFAVPFGTFGPSAGEKKGGRINLGGGGGGKGGGGEDPAKTAQRIAALQLDAVISGLRAEQEANKRALDLRRRDFNDYATQYMVIENRRHDAVVAGLDREQKAAEKLKKGREVALLEVQNKRAEENTTHEQNRNRILDERAGILDQIDKFLRDQDRDIARLTNTTDQWDQAYQQLVDTLKEEGVTLEENTRIRIESNNALARERELVLSVTRARQVLQSVRERVVTKAGRERPSWEDLGGGSTVGGEPATTERPRIATVDEQVMRERLAKIREQMHELAGDLTNVFSQSISDGFNNGIKSGLQTLAQGLLQIVQDVFLRRMAQGLGDMLSGIAGSQGAGGGGFFGSLLRGLLGGVTGGLGGSIGGLGSVSAGGMGTVFAGAIGRDSGGPIWPNQLYKVHKDEYIMPTAPGLVIPKGGMGQTVINKHYTIQLPPDSRGSYNSPKSRRQLSENLIAALEASKA